MKNIMLILLKQQLSLLLLLLLAAGCAQTGQLPSPAQSTQPNVIKGKEFVIVIAGEHDTLQSLAGRYLHDEKKAWLIADFNNIKELSPGREIVIPLTNLNPVAVYLDGYQVVPVLCYHRFGEKKDKMVVTAQAFYEQMNYLYQNDYRVISLAELWEFLQGKRQLPKKAVVITFDDGYKSTYTIAYPILQKFTFPATVFIYTDYVGAQSGLSWEEMKEMVSSGLVDIQPHSKSHSNLGLQSEDEDDAAYRKRIEEEIRQPTEMIRKKLGIPVHYYAYPYGDTNDQVIAQLSGSKMRFGATVQPGGNSSFSYPFMLRRTMVFGDHDMAAFKKHITTFQETALK